MNAFIQLEQKLHVLSRWANPPHLLKGVWMAHSARVTTDGDACRHCEASLHSVQLHRSRILKLMTCQDHTHKK